jgi:hypothetical protein
MFLDHERAAQDCQSTHRDHHLFPQMAKNAASGQ